MACHYPIPFYQDKQGPQSTAGRVQLNPPINTETGCIPCGKCLGCKARRANDWAMRCMHEASLYQHNRFLTLTYTDEHLPPNGWLKLRDVQLWMKRVRKAFPQRIRYFLTGEYGSATRRPHYHALLFNCRFDDERKIGKLWTSEQANKLWGLGDVRIGMVETASATYVAKYSLKSGKGHPTDDGELPPEPFSVMSTKPGIGAPWLERYEKDLQHGYLIQDARKNKIPRGIMKQLTKLDPQLAEKAAHAAQAHTRTKHDLTAAEKIHESKNKLFHARPL